MCVIVLKVSDSFQEVEYFNRTIVAYVVLCSNLFLYFNNYLRCKFLVFARGFRPHQDVEGWL